MVERPAIKSSLIKENPVFWSCFLLFLLLIPIPLFTLEQGSLLQYFNANRQPNTDLFFKYATKIGEEPTYLLATISCLFIRYRYAILIPIIGVLVTLVAFLAKSFFLHPRPSVYYKSLGQLETIQTIEGVQLLGGLTSFPSGHTMSAFALFSFLAFLLPKKGFVNGGFFLLAVVVGLSRIYLAQHFLKDVYVGAIMGVTIGAVVYLWQYRFPINEKVWVDRKMGGVSFN